MFTPHYIANLLLYTLCNSRCRQFTLHTHYMMIAAGIWACLIWWNTLYDVVFVSTNTGLEFPSLKIVM